ncbi:replicative DNA helicase [Lonepinella sp. BR2474]|uniref:replicative DNA helicase n=1 Tax=Lonepinella sp. BR2474 TaxID=3434548 RepID=UPI003F6DE2E0
MTNPKNIQSVTFEVEFSVVGSLLLGGLTAAARDVLTWLMPEMFATANLRFMYEAIQRQALQDNVIDIVLLNSDYGQDLAMLADITRKTPSAANLDGYAEKVRLFHQRRKAQEIILKVADELNRSRDDKLDEITTQGLAELSKLLVRDGKVLPVAMSSLLNGYVDLMEKRSQPSYKEQLLFTGVTCLDDKLCGIGDTDICIVAGRAGNGKTETAITFTKNIITQGGAVLFFSLEMSREQIMDRMIASVSGVSSVRLRNPTWMTNTDYSAVGQAITILQDKPFFIVDKSGLTVDDILAIAERHIQEHGKPKAIMIDYVGLIRHGKLDGRINRTYQIGETMERLKTFCKDQHCPIVLLAQLNRNADGSRPSNGDLRDSGSLEQDASQIIMVHNKRNKEDGEPNQYTEWIVTKNRFGTVGTVYVEFKQGQFIECDQRMAQEALNEQPSGKKNFTKDYSGRGN